MNYLSWNDQIATKFFNPEMRDRRVYLYVTPELIREIGTPVSVDLADFISSIQQGPDWTYGSGICARAERCFVNWRKKALLYPPYLGYLALFVLAAGLRGEFSAVAYYPRLRKLLRERETSGTYPDFPRMHLLWEDLETWSQKDRDGELGVFEIQFSPHFVHVGIPISQTILSEQERLLLPRIFADGALDASSSPSSSLLCQTLRQYGSSRLRRGTLRILDNPEKYHAEFDTLVEAVLQQLAAWDGTVEREGDDGSRKSVNGTLRLWCEDFDDVSGSVALRFLCHTGHEFPEEPLLLKFSGDSDLYQCQEFRSGWSTPLSTASGAPADASYFDWGDGIRATEVNRRWRFALTSSPVRLLASAAEQGLSGYLEIQQLPRDSPFMLLVRSDLAENIEHWGNASCIDFRQVSINSGLPDGWNLYSAQRATSDTEVGTIYPALAFSRTTQITLRGGIRVGGNTYFSFALPDVSVSGCSSEAVIFCNGQKLSERRDGSLELEPANVTDGKITIEVRDGNQTVDRRSIYVQTSFNWPQREAIAWCDRFGRQTLSTEDARASGALTVRESSTPFDSWISVSPLPVAAEIEIDSADNRLRESDRYQPAIAPRIEEEQTEPELRATLLEWRSEVRSNTKPLYTAKLNSLPRGPELTEGTLNYLRACKTKDNRSWNRAIKELTVAATSEDVLVRTIAVALLQLALYRSGRTEKSSQMGGVHLPAHFQKVQRFMRLLAGNEYQSEAAGIGIAEVSPFEGDEDLEKGLV